jgi:transcriptional regulator with XRE-family HTH domain
MAKPKSTASHVLGDAIRHVRRERGYSQEAFAAHAALDRSYYGAIERGEFNVTLQTIVRIATALNITISQLFGRAKL